MPSAMDAADTLPGPAWPRGNTPARRMVAVIGAGFSGTMTAIHLHRTLPRDHAVCLFERTDRFARGVAYAASPVPHLLNVRVGSMSALPDDPGHFQRWLEAHAAHRADRIDASAAGTFATRRLYGRYLRGLLAAEMTRSGGRLRLRAHGVERLRPGSGGGWTLDCADGAVLAADAVVLAAGNLPVRRPGDGVVFHDPWTPQATAGLRPDETVLVVGTGLTMVDLVLGMRAQGFHGPVIALSRRGLVPRRHGPPEPPAPLPEPADARWHSVAALTRLVRRHVAAVERQGGSWRGVMDGLRPVTAQLWQGLDEAQRRRFLRHLRPYWDVHRHRLPPAAADAVEAALQDGSLRVGRGRVTGIERRPGPHGPVADVALRTPAGTTTLTVQRVIHATGTGAGAAEDALLATLLAAGEARADALGLGLDVTGTLRVLARDGRPQDRLWALGPIVRGVFWECTSVPDIRAQAALVATGVAAALATPATQAPG